MDTTDRNDSAGLAQSKNVYRRGILLSTAGGLALAAAGSAGSAAQAANPPSYACDFTDINDLYVYHGVGSYAAQGPRVRQNVELRRGRGRTFVRLHVRPLAADTTVNGMLLKRGEYAASGFSIPETRNQYGTLRFDGRTSRSSYETRYAVMWWGVGGWPERGELDFWEAGHNYPTRKGMKVTNHWAKAEGTHALKSTEVIRDFTKWTAFKVVWKPNLYVVSIDGVEVYRTTENVPDNLMYFAAQTAVEGGSPANQGITPGYIDISNLRYWNN